MKAKQFKDIDWFNVWVFGLLAISIMAMFYMGFDYGLSSHEKVEATMVEYRYRAEYYSYDDDGNREYHPPKWVARFEWNGLLYDAWYDTPDYGGWRVGMKTMLCHRESALRHLHYLEHHTP